ncbi:DUF2490 domain-containing protein [Lentisphaera marina]|uniref:DUF2490 domain-containing protein n=1 Tax=Lentisphaera marina TaxID=1111041 RepID=UPI0023669847|nr:DUF2490 domain-containing protein [Lentisphaera marina]MDD7983826.1 DUF2490 domain-containing protein [Lentisphaera marina]
MKKISLIIIIFTSFITKAEELGYLNWTTFSTKVDDVKLSLFFDNRFRDGVDKHYFRFASLKVAYPIHDNFDIGFNYSRYDSKAIDGDWKYGRRYEFELNPHYTFKNDWKLSLRNRLELRRIEDKGSDNTRSRHRPRVDIPIETRWKAFKGIFMSNEFYIDYNDSTRWVQSDFQPFGLNFLLANNISFSVFYMDQYQRSSGTSSWDSNALIGTSLTIIF